MTKTLQRTLVVLTIALGGAVVWSISMRSGEDAFTAHESAAPRNSASPDSAAVPSQGEVPDSTGPSGEASPAPGKSGIRPGPEELAKRRLEMRRMNAVERLQKLKEAGMGDKHPSVLAASEELQKIEAEQAGSSGGDKASN